MATDSASTNLKTIVKRSINMLHRYARTRKQNAKPVSKHSNVSYLYTDSPNCEICDRVGTLALVKILNTAFVEYRFYVSIRWQDISEQETGQTESGLSFCCYHINTLSYKCYAGQLNQQSGRNFVPISYVYLCLRVW